MHRLKSYLAVLTMSILLAAGLAGCKQHGKHAVAEAEGSAQQVTVTGRPRGAADVPGLSAYNEVKQLLLSESYEAAARALENAVAQNAEFAEAWYQLGAARTRLAILAVSSDERGAVQLFRSGVEAKRTARQLMSMNKYKVLTPAQQRQAWNDLKHALDGVDEVMADESSLIKALHLWAS